MSFLKVKNRAKSTLAAGISDSDLSLTVAAGEGALFPASNFHITIEDEILLCSSRSTDVLTVVREQEGTTKAAHAGAEAVELRITAGTFENLERGCGQTNFEVLSAGKTLTPGTDAMYQYFDENGANRIITLATATAKAGDRFIIRHNGVYNDSKYLQIKQSTTELDKIYAGAIKEFIFDGTNWISGENGSGENDNKKNNVTIGFQAKGYDHGTSIGYLSQGYTRGVAIGNYAQGYIYGVAVGEAAKGYNYGTSIGNNANGFSYGVAIGRETNTYENRFAVAIGYRAKATRYAEIAHNINANSAALKANITIGGFEIQTTNNTPTEMLCGGYANKRFTIKVESILTFTMLISARDNVSGDCAAYKVEGAIKRDAAGNTAMLAAATITVIHEDDASWNVAVTADDTNESLKIEVTGDATNIVQWGARLDGVEAEF